MNEREIFIIRAALTYMVANLDEINSSFDTEKGKMSVNGDEGDFITENEVDNLLSTFQ